MKELSSGHRVKVISGAELEVIDKLVGGDNSSLYRIKYKGKERVLKWYSPNKFNENLFQIIKNKIEVQIDTPNSFLRPIGITEDHDGAFGYLIDFIPPDYKGFSRFLNGKEIFSSVRTLIRATLCITAFFTELHSNGYCFRSFSANNIFISPETGDILFYDNDNITPYGFSPVVDGLCHYMAPEIVMGKKCPDIHTDRYLLAVILFLLLFGDHPLEGKRTMFPCLTAELEKKIFGNEPVFIYDPNDDSNRPVRGVHINVITNWQRFPDFIQKTFIEAFSNAALVGAEIEHRMTEKQWQDTFISLRDKIINCSCGSETFIDPDNPSSLCIECGKNIPKPPIMKVQKYQVVLYPGNKLYKCHVEGNCDDCTEIMGEVVQSKSSQDRWGIKNLCDLLWIGTSPRGEQRLVGKGEIIPIAKGFKVEFGNNNVTEIQ